MASPRDCPWNVAPVRSEGLSLGRGRTGRAVPLGYTARPMSKVCAVCGKKPGFGNNRSHSMVATKRRFNPNLQRVRVLLKGKATRAYVCTRCLKGGKVQKQAPRGQQQPSA
jgi:large subunit ribosomal protein L28